MRGELVQNRVIVWKISDAKKLFGAGYYGKPVGIAKPKPGEIDAPLVLDLIEALYLLERGRVAIYRGGTPVTAGEMAKLCAAEHDNFEKKYAVYRHFRELGYVINPGIKFGCDFAVYERGPGIDHAPYLVQVYGGSDRLAATGVILAGRLATSVKKQFILAIPRKRGVDFMALDWWRA